MQLQLAGWNDFWAHNFTDYAKNGLAPARVLARFRYSYSLWTASGETGAEVAGALLHRAQPTDLPAVGDWVAVRQDAPDGPSIITDVLPRKTKFSRKVSGTSAEEQVIAANIDLLVIVCGLDHDYNLRRLERYLVAAGQSGAKTAIMLNKADLCADLEERVAVVKAIARAVPVVAISALSAGEVSEQIGGAAGKGALEALLPMIAPGETAALVGSSGAGKSTIVNQLLGRAAQATQPTDES
ncbi:MAG: hypothetical protein JWN42_1749, partial [Candidatus Angelobacter sp.]|nr:hypothetical protein [Candidatus Angelobacter sp.]